MKTIYNSSTRFSLILFVVFLFSSTLLNAQFATATIASSDYKDCTPAIITATSVENTGSDYIRYDATNNKSVIASVWDGSAPTFAYQHITSSLTTHCSLAIAAGSGYTVYDPDVSLFYRVVSGTKYMFALVCFRNSATQRIYLELLEFDFIGLTFTSISLTQLYATTTGNTAVNIDSDQFEHYAVTFDHDTKIYYVAGKWTGSGTNQPTICQTATLLPQQSYVAGGTISYPYAKPDVCVYASSNQTAACDAVFTFIADNGTVIVAELQRLVNLCVGTSLATVADVTYTVPNSGDLVDWPRIASHKDQAAYAYLQDGYCVVYEYANSSSNLSNIGGITKFTDFTVPLTPVTTFNRRIYTDGSQQFYGTSTYLPVINSTADYMNSKPAVTYDAKSGNVVPEPTTGNPVKSVIAWTVSEIQAPTYVFPVALYLENAYGEPWTDLTVGSPVYDFYQVPKPLNRGQYAISLAAEQAPKFLYTWFDAITSEMHYKRITPGAPLRIASGSSNVQPFSFSDFDQLVNSNQITKWQLYRMDGALMFSSGSGKFNITDFINSTLTTGIYLVKFLTTENEVSTARILKF